MDMYNTNAQLLETSIRNAMKAKDNFTRDVLRGLKDALQKYAKNISIDFAELSQEQFTLVVKREIKACNDLIEAVKEKVGEAYLTSPAVIEKQKAVELLTEYMPYQMTETEIVVAVKKILGNTTETGINIGRAMKKVMAELKGKADGRLINNIVNQVLND